VRTLPLFLKKYFWDIDFSDLDVKKKSFFIIQRILEYGDQKAVEWMRKNFNDREIRKVIFNSKNLSQKSANFWQLIFNLNKNKILCLNKSFLKKRELIWKF